MSLRLCDFATSDKPCKSTIFPVTLEQSVLIIISVSDSNNGSIASNGGMSELKIDNLPPYFKRDL